MGYHCLVLLGQNKDTRNVPQEEKKIKWIRQILSWTHSLDAQWVFTESDVGTYIFLYNSLFVLIFEWSHSPELAIMDVLLGKWAWPPAQASWLYASE